MRPITLRNRALQKGPSSSSEFNQLRNDIQRDITTLFDISNEHESVIAENMDHVLREHYFVQNRLAKLSDRVKELEREVENGREMGQSYMLRSFYQASNVLPGQEGRPVEVDTLHGLVSPLVVKNHNKMAFKNDLGEYILPSTFEVSVQERTNAEPVSAEDPSAGFYGIDTNGIRKAFDGDKNSFWVRNVETNETECVTEVEALIHVKIPQNISNNVYTNTLTLHPSPEYAMSVLDIQYRNQNGEWRRLETYPVKKNGSGEVPVEIEEAGKLVFAFPKRQVTELKVHIKQPYWFKHENKRIFMYGFQDIVAEYREYSQNAAEFVTRFSLEGTDRRFASISQPLVKAPIGTPALNEANVKQELYLDEGLAEQFLFGTDIFQPVQTVYVKTILQGTGDAVPILREMELPYRHEGLDGF